MATTTTALPLRAAAARMGLSTDTLRKRLQRGLTPGRKVDGQWFVVPDGGPDVSVSVQDTAAPVHDQTGPVPDDREAPPGAPGALLATQRAAEMAEYTERLLAPWRAVVQQQAERIGRLEEQLAAAQASAVPQNGSAPPPVGEARRWWQRLLWG